MIHGQDVVDIIKYGPPGDNGIVPRPDSLASAAIAADLQETEQPVILVERTDSPTFIAKLKEAGEQADICDLPKPRTLFSKK